MGSIHLDDVHDRHDWKNDGDGFRSFKIVGLASEQTTTPTGMRDEHLLLSWLILLLRTREGSQIGFDWAFRGRANGFEHEPVNRHLSMGEVMTGLQNSVGQVAASISRHIAIAAPSRPAAMSSPVSLLLSTSFLSQTSEEVKDEVSE